MPINCWEHDLKSTLCIALFGIAIFVGRETLGDDSQPIEVDQETADALLLIGATEFAGIDDSAIYYSFLREEVCACKPGNVPGEKLRVCTEEDCGRTGSIKCSTQPGATTANCTWVRKSTEIIYVLID